MSMQPQPVSEIPEETMEVAHAVFPQGNIYLTLRDRMGTLYRDEDFADLFAVRGQPAETPWRLAWITILQFMENLTDRQAADAVRSRIDWKYLLGLPLRDAGFHYSVLCEFRQRLVKGGAVEHLLVRLLELCRESSWLKERGRQRTDSTHVLARVRILNRLELVGVTLQATLNRLAQVVPEWLRRRFHPTGMSAMDGALNSIGCPSMKVSDKRLPNRLGVMDCIF